MIHKVCSVPESEIRHCSCTYVMSAGFEVTGHQCTAAVSIGYMHFLRLTIRTTFVYGKYLFIIFADSDRKPFDEEGTTVCFLLWYHFLVL